jgi:pyruvate/2-oxoglutarate dehydrogenase complex dihydrolipoamide acyltransferase (E2) component
VVEIDVTPVVLAAPESAGAQLLVHTLEAAARALSTASQPLSDSPGAGRAAVGFALGRAVRLIPQAEDLSLAGLRRAVGEAATVFATPADVRQSLVVVDAGSHGLLLAAPSLDGPPLAVLAIGAAVRRPVLVGDLGQEQLAFRWLAQFSLRYDASRFPDDRAAALLRAVKARIESEPAGDRIAGAAA